MLAGTEVETLVGEAVAPSALDTFGDEAWTASVPVAEFAGGGFASSARSRDAANLFAWHAVRPRRRDRNVFAPGAKGMGQVMRWLG